MKCAASLASTNSGLRQITFPAMSMFNLLRSTLQAEYLVSYRLHHTCCGCCCCCLEWVQRVSLPAVSDAFLCSPHKDSRCQRLVTLCTVTLQLRMRQGQQAPGHMLPSRGHPLLPRRTYLQSTREKYLGGFLQRGLNCPHQTSRW